MKRIEEKFDKKSLFSFLNKYLILNTLFITREKKNTSNNFFFFRNYVHVYLFSNHHFTNQQKLRYDYDEDDDYDECLLPTTKGKI